MWTSFHAAEKKPEISTDGLHYGPSITSLVMMDLRITMRKLFGMCVSHCRMCVCFSLLSQSLVSCYVVVLYIYFVLALLGAFSLSGMSVN